jgi:hypothetical protein
VDEQPTAKCDRPRPVLKLASFQQHRVRPTRAARLGQISPRLQHQILQGNLRAARRVRRTRTVREVQPIQALALGPLDPVSHRRHRDAELLGNRTQRLATTHGGYHGSTTLGLTLSLLIIFHLVGSVLGYIIVLLCSGSSGTKVFGMYWH